MYGARSWTFGNHISRVSRCYIHYWGLLYLTMRQVKLRCMSIYRYMSDIELIGVRNSMHY